VTIFLSELCVVAEDDQIILDSRGDGVMLIDETLLDLYDVDEVDVSAAESIICTDDAAMMFEVDDATARDN